MVLGYFILLFCLFVLCCILPVYDMHFVIGILESAL